MKDLIRVVLIDPIEKSRADLQRSFATLTNIKLAGTFETYVGAAKKIAEIAPDLVVVVLDGDSVPAVKLIQTVVESNPGIAVLPASEGRDSSIILTVIRAGAREFLTLPSEGEQLLETIQRLLNRRIAPSGSAETVNDKGPQVIAITGAAGGIGCTTLAVNLATTLAKTSTKEVVLADFDLMLGSLDACLDIVPDQTLQGIVQSIDRLDLTLLKRSMTRHASGLYVLPHPVAMEDAAKIDPESLRRVLVLLKAAFPTVIIDTSKGLQTSDFVAFELADLIVIVIQLDLTCLRNTARLLHLFSQFEGLTERVRLVVNRSGSNESDISLKKAEETLKMSVSWQIPNSTKIVSAARAKGVPIDIVAPGSRLHQSILEIAKGLKPNSEREACKQRRGLFAAFF